MENSLNVTAKPDVDVSAIDRLLAKIGEAKRALASLGSDIRQAERSLDVELRRNFADDGLGVP